MNELYGGPAFPSEFNLPENQGMTLRDYFAAAALTGIQQWDAIVNTKKPIFAEPGSVEELASISYKIADAMLKERAK